MYYKFESALAWVLAIWSGSELYGDNTFNAVIWIVMFRMAYRAMTYWRTKYIFQQSKDQIRSHDRPQHEVLEFQQFPAEAQKYISLHTAAVGMEGFRPLVCYRNHAYAGGPGEVNCSAVYVDGKQTTIVSLGYIRKARWFFVPIPFPKFTGELIAARVIESYFDGPGRIVATDLELARALVNKPLNYITIAPVSAPFPELLKLHRQNVEQVMKSHDYKIGVIDCADEFFEWDLRFRHASSRDLEAQLQACIDENGLDFIAPE